MSKFEEFLDADFEYADKTFREFLKACLTDLLDLKRIGGADSGWQSALFEQLSIIDPKVADREKLKALDDAYEAEDWETAGKIERTIIVDQERAEQIYLELIDYLLEAR